MATKKSTRRRRAGGTLSSALREVTEKLADCRSLKKGTILFRTTDDEGQFALECSDRGVQIRQDPSQQTPAAIEIIGSSRQLRGVLAGEIDARARFLAGAFRVRGDLRYLSDLAVELNLLKEPL